MSFQVSNAFAQSFISPSFGNRRGWMTRAEDRRNGILPQHHGYKDNSHTPTIPRRYEDAGKLPEHHGYQDGSHEPDYGQGKR